ncbi:MAG TPA: nucleotidyl transferase AbiEii/AbiGii toxin family protein [Pyrinomonadaceae bacterium]
MTNASLDLSSKVPKEHVDVIRRVVRTATNLSLTNLFIVGAQARDLILQYAYDVPVHRATNDIDFGIIVETWEEFEELREALIANEGFQVHPNQKQRLIHNEGAIIDLVPFGNVEQAKGLIAWPPDFVIEMSTVGFREAYANSIDVRLDEDLVVKVASLAGLALLKLIAWSDRQYERDAQDFALMMRNYLDAGNQDRLYGERGDCFDLLNDEDFDYDRASARVLGRDIGTILSKESRTVIEQVLFAENEAERFAAVMVRNNANYHGDSDMALAMLEALEQGLSEH